MNIYRHGDLDIKEIEKLPDGLTKINSLVVMEGEATGHQHTLVCDKQNSVSVFVDNKGNEWIEAEENCAITHPEHKTLEIKKGYYQVEVEREFNPFDEAILAVRD